MKDSAFQIIFNNNEESAIKNNKIKQSSLKNKKRSGFQQDEKGLKKSII